MKDMRVDHRRLNIAMPQQLLDGSNVRAAFEQVRGKQMAERMARGPFRETGHHHGISDGFLHQGFINRIATLFLGLHVDPSVLLGKDPLPAPRCRAAPLLAETIPAAARIDDGERSLTCDRQEVLVSRNQQIGIAIDRRRKHPPVIRIANGKR